MSGLILLDIQSYDHVGPLCKQQLCKGRYTMKFNTSKLVGAAVAGLLSAAALTANAAEGTSAAPAAAPAAGGGHCVGANSCKGKGSCSQKGANDCAGKNGCKGKGWVEKSKTECDAMAKKNKNVKFEAAG
jgi:hypothetical protein